MRTRIPYTAMTLGSAGRTARPLSCQAGPAAPRPAAVTQAWGRRLWISVCGCWVCVTAPSSSHWKDVQAEGDWHSHPQRACASPGC